MKFSCYLTEKRRKTKTTDRLYKTYVPNVTLGGLTIFTATAKHILSWLSSKASTLHTSTRTYLCFMWLDDIKHWFSSLSVAVKAGCVHASLSLLESTHQWGSLLFGNHGHRNYQNWQSSVVLLGIFPACSPAAEHTLPFCFSDIFEGDKSFSNLSNDCTNHLQCFYILCDGLAGPLYDGGLWIISSSS